MELLTTNEAAKILRVTPIRVRQMIREGKIAARQVGRDYIIEESSLESVKTYGKAGRPKNTADTEKNGNKKPFKTIFDIEGELAETLAGSLDSGLGDLSTNKKYMEGFGTKEAEKRAMLKRNENNR
jgi:excisionase family DNA binding protein